MVGIWVRITVSTIPRRSRRDDLLQGNAKRYGIKTVVDEMDDPVMTAYVAWPERLYFVDIDGKIAYASGPGPWGFKPEELKTAIDGSVD